MAPKNEQLSAAEKAEIMGEGFSLAHQQQAQERYGNTADWAEYQRRTATMNVPTGRTASSRPKRWNKPSSRRSPAA